MSSKKYSIRRTIGSELTLLLSVITTIIAVFIGVIYYLYSSHIVAGELIAAAEQTADEFSQVLVLPLYNYDKTAIKSIAEVYLASGRIGEVLIKAPDMGVIFDNIGEVSSSLPVIQKTVYRRGLELGSIQFVFDDSPIAAARKRAVWTTLITIIIVQLIYILSLRVILGHLLIKPLSQLGSRLQEISGGSYEGRLAPVPQHDLNEIVMAANRMSDEIAHRTGILVENEKNYRTVYDSSSDAIFIHDAEDDGAIVDVNQAMLDMYGYSRKEIMALPLADLCLGESPYSSVEAAAYVGKAITIGPQLFKWYARRKDGSLFWVEVALKKARISDMDVILATVRDISERVLLEEQLRQAQKMEAIGTLAGGIAHDFNNILTSILGYTELALIQADRGSVIHAYLQQVDKASKRARELVQQILTFSRKQKQVKKVVRLEPLVCEALKLLRATIPTTVDIQLDLASKAKVRADPSQMLQLIMNLCTNGYQALPDASGTLVISLKDRVVGKDDVYGLEPGNYVILEVCDSGIGMDAETKAKIFEPYFTTKETGKGTGLGMSTVYGIVESHHGWITVDSEPGTGTKFRIYLPVTDDEMDVFAAPLPNAIPQVNKRVMVVDDEEDVRILITQILVHGGYQADCFASGSAAWQAMTDTPSAWDLLVTDQTMPGMTGVELVRKVLQVRPDMPVILCTGYSEMVDEDRALELGICMYLQKPVTLQEMLAAAYEALHGQLEAQDPGTA